MVRDTEDLLIANGMEPCTATITHNRQMVSLARQFVWMETLCTAGLSPVGRRSVGPSFGGGPGDSAGTAIADSHPKPPDGRPAPVPGTSVHYETSQTPRSTDHGWVPRCARCPLRPARKYEEAFTNRKAPPVTVRSSHATNSPPCATDSVSAPIHTRSPGTASSQSMRRTFSAQRCRIVASSARVPSTRKISSRPTTRLYAQVMSPEQSNAGGRRPPHWYGAPSWVSAQSRASAAHGRVHGPDRDLEDRAP